MSAAVIMLAIVVLWAVVLVPLWLRRDGAEPVRIEAELPAWEEPEDVPEVSPEQEASPDERLVRSFAPAAAVHTASAHAPSASPSSRPSVSPRPSAPPEPSSSPSPSPSLESGPKQQPRRRPGTPTRQRPGPSWRPSARVIARRRRRLLWCTLLVAITAGLAIGGVTPWWGAAPAPVLLFGYLVVLRAAVRADAERREAYLRHKAELTRRRRETERQRVQRKREIAEERKAKVIQLETHLADQPYDQYEDARLRAVGD